MIIFKTRKQLTFHGLFIQEITPVEIGQTIVKIKPLYLARVAALTSIIYRRV